MIFFKSIPLSLAVFWRFLIVLPVFIPIALAVTLSFSLTFGLLMPFLIGLFFNAAYAFLTLVGIRAGFQALGVYSAPSFGNKCSARLMVSHQLGKPPSTVTWLIYLRQSRQS
jgi:hypothetical protein